MSLTFDADTHTYRYKGERVPSVTQALSVVTDEYLRKIPPERLERKRQIGSAVHKAIELDLRGELDPDTIAPVWAAYFAAWTQFRDLLAPEDIGPCEVPRYSHGWRYAGTPDLVLRVFNPRKAKKHWAIVDVKCSWQLHPAVGPQTEAYRDLLNNDPAQPEMIADRYALHLKPTGSYKLIPLDEPHDMTVFLSCLSLYRWKERYLGSPDDE